MRFVELRPTATLHQTNMRAYVYPGADLHAAVLVLHVILGEGAVRFRWALALRI